MERKSKFVCLALALGFCMCSPALVSGQGVRVFFDPSVATVGLNGTVDINLVADITDPVFGWGLDLLIGTPSITTLTSVAINASVWDAAFAPDGDGLAALSRLGSTSGNGIVLATLTFSGDAIGQSFLWASDTPGDPTEGWPLDPTGFDTAVYEKGSITVTPEPTTLSLLALGALGLIRRRR